MSIQRHDNIISLEFINTDEIGDEIGEEVEYANCLLYKNSIVIMIDNKKIPISYDYKNGLIAEKSYPNFYFMEWKNDLIEDPYQIRIYDNQLQRKLIPKNNYVKNLFLLTSIKRGKENLFYNHIIINKREDLIPEIYKSTEREIIMKKYYSTLEELEIIDDNHYKFKKRSKIYYSENLISIISDRIFFLITELFKLDINPGNFVTTEELDIRIIDFGQSTFHKGENDIVESHFLYKEEFEGCIIRFKRYYK